MSSTRNKRKRPENDPNVMAPASRRRSRDSRAAADAATAAAASQKNEGPEPISGDDSTATKKADGVASSTVETPRDKGIADNKTPHPSKSPGEEARSTRERADPGAGSSEAATLPKEPLHLSAGGNKAENTSTKNADPDDSDRASKMRDIIAHRSLLLSRIRLCRSAADKRLTETKSSTQSTGAAQQKTGGTSRELTDDDEIQAHREMARLASLAAKRARSEGGEGQAEKRTSLSLRRGSSVGKRMNAALSSLAPGVAVPTGSGANFPVPVQLGSAPGGKSFQNPATTATSITPGQIPSATKVASTLIPHAPSLPSTKKAKAGPGQGHQLSRPASVGAADGKQIRTLPGGKAFKSSNQSLPRADTGHGSVRPSNPHSNLTNRLPQPKTNFTEAMLLRKKRDSLNAKLRAVMDRQKNRGSGVENIRRSAASTGKSSRFSSGSGLEIGPGEELPKRRKTHWDRLLQEMSWLATDFIEERKWKMSSARTIASAVSSSGQHLGPTAAKKLSTAALTTKAELDATDDARTVAISEDSTKHLSPLEERKYLKPSSEETRTARKAGRLMSAMVSELVVAVGKGGSTGSTDDFHTEALARYKKIRAKLLNDMPSGSQSSTSSKDAHASTEDNPQCGEVKMDVDENPSQTQGPDDDSGELTFSDINKRISKLGLPNGKRDKFAYKDLATAVTGKKLDVSNEQKEMIEFIDGIWSTTSAGAMLSGLPVSGKTVATCSLLWKHKLDGPQLIICPPASMLRWKYEISTFKDLRVLNFGLVGGIGCTVKGVSFENISPGPGDIVLCEYSSVGKVLELLRDEGIDFRALCIDCRHPEGMFGCIGSDESNLTRDIGWHGSTELITVDWWDNIMALAASNSPRRLMIDYCDPDTYSLDRSGVGQRQQLEIMSLRTAFLVGPATFRPSNYPLPRTVISWARHQRRMDGEDKFERVRRVLQETALPMSINITKALSSPPPTSWDIRECDMPSLQRQAYDSCCSHIRGALSSSLGTANMQDDLGPNTYLAVSSALFRLRQICLTSGSLEKIERGEPGPHQVSGTIPFVNTEPCSFGASPPEASSFKMASDNSSQPDIELAEVLLTSSAKFLELMSILRNECGYELECDEAVDALMKPTGKEKPTESYASRPNHRKVVIFANLPRTQWLVSILLGSLGLRHKLIRREFSHSFTGSSGVMAQHNQAALAFSESQHTLAAFNSERATRDKMGIYDSADIIIVSPDSLASWHGGIGVDSADTVISLDEDWSGREMGTLEACMTRWNACTSLRRTPSKMIRLICKDTIEENVFESSDTDNDSSIFQWPLDRSGNHFLYMDIDALVPIYRTASQSRTSKIHLPGLDILRLRGKPLDSVLLSSTELEPLFGKGSNMLFLPLDDGNDCLEKRDDNEITRELFFLRALFELECRETSKDLSESTTDSLSFTRKHHFGSGVLPPEPGLFPEDVMSRSDLQFLSIRNYFERQILLSGRSSSGSGGITLSRLSDTTGIAPNLLPESSTQGGSAMADAWRKSGLGSKPDEMAKALLCYRPIRDGKRGGESVPNLSKTRTGGRFNAYSRIYSSAWDENCVRDGSQGCEPVVFFPPTHPKIQLAPAATTQKPIAHPIKEHDQFSPASSSHMKRKEIDNVNVSGGAGSKRPRIDASAGDADSRQKEDKAAEDATLEKPAEPTKHVPNQAENPPLQSTPKNEKNIVPSAGPSEISTTPEHEEEGYKEDDYGLLGRGVLPLPADSALLMANETTRVGDRSGSEDFVQNFLVYDEEAESYGSHDSEDVLQLIALFVKRRPRNMMPIREQPGQPYHPHTGLFPGDPRRASSRPTPTLDPVASAISAREANGDENAKKAKKKVNSQVTSSAFTRIPNAGQIRQPSSANPAHPNGKDSQKHRMLATYVSRQFGTGLSMFESSSFRVAMMQIQKRVIKRVNRALVKSFLSSDAGPGLPLNAVNQPKAISEFEQGIVHFTSIVQELKPGSNTGDAAKTLAIAQRSSLRRSLASPCRVDFGPFAGGFLGSPAGMTGISPPRSRLGVSLPMGVKVTQTTHDQAQVSWTAEEDKLLQEAAVRFGMNWIIVARALSGVEGFLVTDTGAGVPACRLAQPPRSAKHCRDHWQSLARSQPSLANEVRKSEKILRENALKRADSMGREEDPSIRSSALDETVGEMNFVLLSRPSLYENKAEDQDKMDVDPFASDEPNVPPKSTLESETKAPPLPPKRSFSILKAAMAKRQIVPLTIPGIPPGGQPNQPVPSHPSHMQSVQSSVAAQWSNGRTEMWPLQILDCADKHRAAVRASAQLASEQKQAASSAAASARKPAAHSSGNAPPSANNRNAASGLPAPMSSRPASYPSSQRPAASSTSPKKTPVGSSTKSSSSAAKKSDKSKAPPSKAPPKKT